jgi:hypothetical protein
MARDKHPSHISASISERVHKTRPQRAASAAKSPTLPKPRAAGVATIGTARGKSGCISRAMPHTRRGRTCRPRCLGQGRCGQFQCRSCSLLLDTSRRAPVANIHPRSGAVISFLPRPLLSFWRYFVLRISAVLRGRTGSCSFVYSCAGPRLLLLLPAKRRRARRVPPAAIASAQVLRAGRGIPADPPAPCGAFRQLKGFRASSQIRQATPAQWLALPVP